jgi:hypothetical protein
VDEPGAQAQLVSAKACELCEASTPNSAKAHELYKMRKDMAQKWMPMEVAKVNLLILGASTNRSGEIQEYLLGIADRKEMTEDDYGFKAWHSVPAKCLRPANVGDDCVSSVIDVVNHGDGGKVNCEFRKEGDDTIGVYAIKDDLRPGDKLFADYGPSFNHRLPLRLYRDPPVDSVIPDSIVVDERLANRWRSITEDPPPFYWSMGSGIPHRFKLWVQPHTSVVLQVTCRAAGGMPIVVPSDEWRCGFALVLSEPSVWKVANVSWNDGFNYYTDLQELRDQCGCSGTDYLDACMQAEKALHGRVNEALMRRGIEDPEPACPGLDLGDLMSMSEEQLAERDAINAIYGQQFHDVKNELMADEELYLESRGLGGDSYAIQGATHEALAHRNLNTDSDDDEFKWPDDGGPALMDYASGPRLQARLEWFARRDDALRKRDDAVQHPDGHPPPHSA